MLTTGLDKGVFASARKRAYLIARTELHRARQKGAVDIYKYNKIKQVHWVAISDDRICDRCAGRANRIYRVRDLTDEDFPPIHPRCRCRLLPTDFQLEIKVKHGAEGKVMETKVYPSPQNYKYIIKIKKSLDIDEKELSREIKKVDTSPTEAEKKSGTYQKGHIDVGGLDVSIENPKGSYRSGVSRDGTKWKTQLHSHYGYIRGTKGRDKDHIDVFIGDNLDRR